MAKCAYCGVNEVIGKAKTCSTRCRKAISRGSVTKCAATVTNAKCDTPTVTSEQQMYNDWQEEINNLPLGVVKPRWKPGVEPTCWQESREYFLTIVTLLVHPVAELEKMVGHIFIPSWKYKAEGYFEERKVG